MHLLRKLPSLMRTCEENLALRAWASAHAQQPPTPAAQLRSLLDYPALRPVYRRLARKALESGKAAAIASELLELQREVTRAEDARLQVQHAFPTLYKLLPCPASTPTC
jgi:hypothetical protein